MNGEQTGSDPRQRDLVLRRRGVPVRLNPHGLVDGRVGAPHVFVRAILPRVRDGRVIQSLHTQKPPLTRIFSIPHHKMSD